MNWNELESKIYFREGSWLDIYVNDTTRTDWQKWVQYINHEFKIEWYNGKTEKNDTTTAVRNALRDTLDNQNVEHSLGKFIIERIVKVKWIIKKQTK